MEYSIQNGRFELILGFVMRTDLSKLGLYCDVDLSKSDVKFCMEYKPETRDSIWNTNLQGRILQAKPTIVVGSAFRYGLVFYGRTYI